MLVCRVMCFSQTTYILSPISDTEGKVQMGNNQSRSPLWNIILSFCSVYLPLYEIAKNFCLRVYWRYNSFSLLSLIKLCRIFDFLSVRGMAVSILSFTTMIWSHMRSLSTGNGGVDWDQTTASNEVTVSMATMHFIFAYKSSDNKENRP